MLTFNAFKKMVVARPTKIPTNAASTHHLQMLTNKTICLPRILDAYDTRKRDRARL